MPLAKLAAMNAVFCIICKTFLSHSLDDFLVHSCPTYAFKGWLICGMPATCTKPTPLLDYRASLFTTLFSNIFPLPWQSPRTLFTFPWWLHACLLPVVNLPRIWDTLSCLFSRFSLLQVNSFLVVCPLHPHTMEYRFLPLPATCSTFQNCIWSPPLVINIRIFCLLSLYPSWSGLNGIMFSCLNCYHWLYEYGCVRRGYVMAVYGGGTWWQWLLQKEVTAKASKCYILFNCTVLCCTALYRFA